MKPRLNLVKLESIPILQQLQWEEALLRADQENWCLLNWGSPPAIVMGISGNPHELVRYEKLQESPIPLIRRFSGGGTVVIDENTLFVTLICQTKSLSIHPFPRPIMQWTADHLYHPLFPSLPFKLLENDYTLEGRKWGGNAQSILKERWLHHSSLLWDFHPSIMDYLSIPSKAPSYRNGRSHLDFLCRLCNYHPCRTQFLERVIQQLGQYFTLLEKNINHLKHIAALPHRKATHVFAYEKIDELI